MNNTQYIIIDIETAECRTGFSTEEQALEHIKENAEQFTIVTKENYDDVIEVEDGSLGRLIMILPMKWTTDRHLVELILYPSFYKSALFGNVAEYQDDVDNYDLLCGDIPVSVADYSDFDDEEE